MTRQAEQRRLDRYQREKYRSALKCFSLAGLLLLFLAYHDYALLTRFEEQRQRISLSHFYLELYASAGKWGVVGYDLSLGAVVFAGSLYCLWRLSSANRTSF